MMARPGGREVVRVGLLGRSGAGACPNLLQRRPAAGSAASRSAEYQRLSSGVLVGFGPLQQIWTTGKVILGVSWVISGRRYDDGPSSWGIMGVEETSP